MDSPTVALLIFTATMGVAVLVSLILAALGPAEARQRRQAGALLSVALSSRELIITVPRGPERETWIFSVDLDAELRLDGAPTSLEALRKGDLVEIVYIRQAQLYLALQVEARTAPSRGPASGG